MRNSRRPTGLAAVALGLLAAGCQSVPDRPGTVPLPAGGTKPDTLEIADVHGNTLTEYTNSPATIGALTDWLGRHDDHWTTITTKFPPTPQRVVTCYNEKAVVLILLVGDDWLGGRLPERPADEFNKRPLSPAERAELTHILDVSR